MDGLDEVRHEDGGPRERARVPANVVGDARAVEGRRQPRRARGHVLHADPCVVQGASDGIVRREDLAAMPARHEGATELADESPRGIAREARIGRGRDADAHGAQREAPSARAST
jgi:hypothetical protein